MIKMKQVVKGVDWAFLSIPFNGTLLWTFSLNDSEEFLDQLNGWALFVENAVSGRSMKCYAFIKKSCILLASTME